MSDYLEFLAGKKPRPQAVGIEPPVLNGSLFDFQAACVGFALRQGRAGLYLDTGLGKTFCQLEWADKAMRAANGYALILTPLAVARQMEREAHARGYDARVIRDQSEAKPGINICNYDRLDKIDAAAFGAVSLDEASILKSFTGKTTRALISAFAGHRFKLAPGDEKHICPMPLDLTTRALALWSNPGDVVLSPFMGIGSEGYCALKAKRRFIGTELKKSYFDQAVRNLRDTEASAPTLFDMIEAA